MTADTAPPAARRVLAELEGRRAGYLPGPWAPEPGTAAGALFEVVAHFGGLAEEGLAQLPHKHFLAFLDAMGITLLAPSAARTPLVFRLAPDAPIDVALAEGSTVAAEIPPPLPATLGDRPSAAAAEREGPILFATEQAVSLSRATLAAVQSVVPAADAFTDHTAGVQSGLVLFDRPEQIPHHLYLGHGTLFEVQGSAEISLQLGVTRLTGPGAAPAGVELKWEYHSAGGWVAFEPVIDQTRGLAVDGEVLLRKVCGPPLAPTTVDGVESFWIRARVIEPLPMSGQPSAPVLPRIDTMRARVRLLEEGLPLDAAFNDGVALDVTKDFLPFGPQPALGASFLIACDDAFKREGAQIRIRIEPSAGNQATKDADRTLTWEYSAGEREWKEFLAGSTEQLQAGSEVRHLSFGRPPDWRKATVNGQEHFWLRVRLSKGDYGGPIAFNADGPPTNVPTPPVLTGMTVTYAIGTAPTPLDHVRSLNRFTYGDHASALRFGRDGFEPFRPIADRQPALYLGFSAPLPVGLMSLFVDVPAGTEAGALPPPSPFVWEYRSSEGWSELPVLDETGGFRARGMVQFIGQPDLTADAGPSDDLFWVRARLKTATATPDRAALDGLHLNAVWASHRTAVNGEVAGQGDGSPGQTIALQNEGILGEAVIEVQEWRGPTREWQSLFQDLPTSRLRYDLDARGRVTAVWVTWIEAAHLHGSGPFDRHYTLDRPRGVVRFGDGDFGMMPPGGAPIVASYRYGGGPLGNVAARTVVQPYDPIPYLESVSNPVAAAGGAPAEAVGRSGGVHARGPNALRHRGRAAAAADYEWIAREASSQIALARCLPVTGPDGLATAGWVTLVIAPWGEEAEPQPSVELLQRVREHLARRAPAAVARQLRVVGPTYQPVSVTADIAIADPSSAAALEEAVRTALARFLHPLTGGSQGNGWGFGESAQLSHIAAVIEGVPGVSYAGELQLATEGAVAGESVAIPVDRLPASGRHLLKLRVEG